MSIPLHHRGFEARRLKLFAGREQFHDEREPPLRIGDVVRLNSDGPLSLIVELPDSKTVTVSWREHSGLAIEADFPLACIHRDRFVG